jgi:hypothetical protein
MPHAIAPVPAWKGAGHRHSNTLNLWRLAPQVGRSSTPASDNRAWREVSWLGDISLGLRNDHARYAASGKDRDGRF